jgi:uncharacterized membrane protein YoaK (UPF0700 family)
MDHAEDKNARRRLHLVQLFAVCLAVLVFAGVQVVRYRNPSNAILVTLGAAGLMINAVNWVLYSRIPGTQSWQMAWLKASRFGATVACAAAIAYGLGESRFSQYALWIVAASLVVSSLLRIFRDETARFAEVWRKKKDHGGAA